MLVASCWPLPVVRPANANQQPVTSNQQLVFGMAHLIEVAFKGNRKDFFLWDADEAPPIKAGVIVDADRGEDLGFVYALAELAEKRNAARTAKNWAESDALRNEMLALGVEVKDTPTGTVWRPRLAPALTP